MPHLFGEKVMLREYRQEDLPCIAAWVNDEETTKYLSDIFVLPQTSKMREDFLSARLTGSSHEACFIIADRETQKYLGQADLLEINWINRCATVGIVIANAEDRSRGVGTEALTLLCEYGFQKLGLQRIQLNVYEANTRAQRCYEKVGFIREGVKRRAIYKDGRFMDMIFMSILKDEWQRPCLDRDDEELAD